MDITGLYNDPSNPFRPVDWRWRRAVDLVESGRIASPGHDDAGVCLARKFFRALRGCQDDAARQLLARRMPALFQTYTIYAGPPSFAKSVIEARLLTEETFAQIADKCNCTPAVIETYELLFFSVRDRLTAEGYILHQVIGPRAHTGLRDDDIDVILKMRAFAGGAVVLDHLIDFVNNPPVLPDRPEQLDPAELQVLRGKFLTRASIVLDAMPINGMTLQRLAVLHDAVSVFRRGRRQGGDSRSVTMPVMVSPICRQTIVNAPGRVGSWPVGEAGRTLAVVDRQARVAS